VIGDDRDGPSVFGFKRFADIVQTIACAAIVGLTAIVWQMRSDIVELQASQNYQNKFYDQQGKLIEKMLEGLQSQNTALRISGEASAAAMAERQAIRASIADLYRRMERVEDRPTIGATPGDHGR